MKLRLGMAMVTAALFATGCDKKADGPAPTQVQAAPVAAPENPTPAEAPAPAPAEAAPTAQAQGGTEAAAPAMGCGSHDHDHGAHAKVHHHGDHAAHGDHAHHDKGHGTDADCPFHDPKTHAAAAAQVDKPAEEAMGCGGKPLVHPAAIDGGGIHYGKSFELAETSPLGAVAAGAADGQELSVRVTGTIDKVCQKKGCWMVVKDGDFEARVIMKDAAFTVPLDSTGKPAQVEGVLKVKVYTEAQAKHLAEDGGQDPAAVTGEKKELLLTATSVEIGG